MSDAHTPPQGRAPFDKPPVYDGKTNMEYAAPGTADWVKEASARLIRIREDYRVLRQWASEQKDNGFAEQVELDAEARLDEWDEPVRRWEP